MGERKAAPFLLVLRACALIDWVCLAVLGEVPVQPLYSKDQVFVDAAPGHGQQSPAAAFAVVQGAFAPPQH